MVILVVENADVVSATLVVADVEALVPLEPGEHGHDDLSHCHHFHCHHHHQGRELWLAGEIDDYDFQRDYCHLLHHHHSPVELFWDVLAMVVVVVFTIGVGVLTIS